MQRAPKRLRALSLILTGWIALLCGCENSALHLRGTLEFGREIKPNLSRINTLDMDPRYYDDGGTRGERVVSELDWSTLSQGSAFVYGKLRRSHCLWVSGEGAPKITYDVIVKNLRVTDEDGDPLELSHDSISYAGNKITHPVTREPVFNGESRLVAPELLNASTDSVVLTLFRDGDVLRDDFAPCGALDRAPVETEIVDGACRGSHPNTNLPSAAIRCGVPTPGGDATYTLDVRGAVSMPDVTVEDHLNRVPPRRLAPNLKLVSGARSLVRRLEFVEVEMANDSCEKIPAGIACREVDDLDSEGNPRDPKANWHWRWATPTLDEQGRETNDSYGHWEDNFDPSLHVSRVRVLTAGDPDRETNRRQREYLSPHRIRLDGRESIGDGEDFEPSDGQLAREFFPDTSIHVTPTYRHLEIQSTNSRVIPSKLSWEVEFRVDPDATGFYELPEVLPQDPVYIEFQVADSASSSQGLTAVITPTSRDLGAVRLSEQSTFERAFRVSNQGIYSITIDRVALSGRSASDFRVKTVPEVALPYTLRGGRSIDLTLVFTSREYGAHNALVEVDVRSGSVRRTLNVPVVARGVDVIPGVLPETMTLVNSTCAADKSMWSWWERRALLENSGHLDLERRSVTVEGQHASYFSIERSDPVTGTSWPIGAPEWVASGRAIDFVVRYTPPWLGRGYASHRARVRFDTNGGERLMDLAGVYCR